MEMRPLGNTTLQVSAICLGTMNWGEQNTEAEAHQQMDRAVEAGINFFDTAEMYPIPPRAETAGLTERYIGSWFATKKNRSRIILASKVAGAADRITWLRDGKQCLNRKNIEQAIEDSLKRLQTDYLDLYQLHWPDRKTNFFGTRGYVHQPDAEGTATIEESLSVLADLVKTGKVRHIGLSNETPWGMMQFLNLSQLKQYPRIVSIQNPYSLLNRQFETGLAEMAIRENVGLLAYSPLAFGALSGKYLKGTDTPNCRLNQFKNHYSRYSQSNASKAVAAYVELALKHGLSPAQMALAFINQQPFVTSNIIGATTLAQLNENIDSITVRLSEEVLKEINHIQEQWPDPSP
jgi:aryl-alcohol dehydrogenase-like predicted oxidoreductase